MMNLKKKVTALIFISMLSFGVTSCNARRFYDKSYSETTRLELGNVQREICEGMSQGQVAVALGSPNIVTADKDKKETWIYDKVSSEVRQSSTSGFILFCQTGVDYVSRRDVSQKTLTVVLKFDENKMVERISYHSSKF